MILPDPGMCTIYGIKPSRFRLVVFKMDLPEQGFWHEHLAYKAMLDCQVQRLRDLAIRSKSRIFGYKFQN
jgi:hypothetical protein